MNGYILSVFVCCVLLAPHVLARSTDKREFKLGVENSDPVKCGTNLKPWITHGCRIDDDRGLTALKDFRSDPNADWSNPGAWLLKVACACRELAIKQGNKFFGLEEYGLCMSAPGRLADYLAKYPKASPTDCLAATPYNKTLVRDDGKICVGGIMRCYFYEIVPDSQSPQAAPGVNEEEAVISEAKSCQKLSDIAIIIDTSGSITNEDFVRLREFTKKLVDRFDVGKGAIKSRLGLISFADKAKILLSWVDSQILTKGQIKDVIENIKYDGGNTATYKALNLVVNAIIKPSKRSGVNPTVFLITDGECYQGEDRLPAPIKLLRDNNVRVIAIGVGDADEAELKDITGNPNLVVYYKDFATIISSAVVVLDKLVLEACPTA